MDVINNTHNIYETDSNPVKFSAGSIMQNQIFTFKFESGDANNYPFDEYITSIDFSGSFVDKAANNSMAEIPLQVTSSGLVPTCVLLDFFKLCNYFFQMGI